jgi:hypothetical protein
MKIPGVQQGWGADLQVLANHTSPIFSLDKLGSDDISQVNLQNKVNLATMRTSIHSHISDRSGHAG